MTKKQVFSRILKEIKPYTFLIVVSLLLNVITVGASLVVPVFVGNAIDVMIDVGNVDFSVITNTIFYVIGITIVSAISQFFISIVNNRVTYSVLKSLRNGMIEKLQKISLFEADRRSAGDTVSAMLSDAESFTDGILLGFTQFFSGVLTVLGTVGFMLYYNRLLALIVILVTPLTLFIAKFISGGTSKNFKKQAKLKAQQTAFIEEMINNNKTVKAYSYENKAQENFDNINNELGKVTLKAVFFSSLTNPVTRFVNNVVYALVALCGGMCALGLWTFGGGLTAGGLTCLLNYSNKYARPFNEISGVITELQSSIVGAERVFTFLDLEEEDEGGLIEGTLDGNVKLDGVYFSYDKSKELLKDLSIDVKKGQRIAIVGPTGCGKTTLINLLTRFYDVDKGTITIDGHNVKDINRTNLRDNYGMVLQESWIRKGTVKENLRVGNENATDEELIEVAVKCRADGFIRRLPLGYDTVIDDDSLSQGEKQLLCIARVMLSNPNILILDEATSSVDVLTELKINQAFDTLMEGRTSFIVAHRLSTVKSADLILVMKSGQVIEKGTHEELLSYDSFYSELYKAL